MEISIDFLKEMGLIIYEKVHPLLGTREAAQKLEKGAGGDISMNIDIIAENTIIEILEKKNLDLLLISEEIGEKYIGNKEKAIKNHFKVIVDPIDGSNNSIRGIPFCCVSIALAIGDKITDINKAVIINLTTKDIYWAEKGKGAYLNDKKIKVSNIGIDGEFIFELDFDYKNALDYLIKYKSLLQKIYRVRVMGSNALSFCLLAQGSIDGFLDLRRSNRLMDIAAGYLIIKEAGGRIFSKNGEDLNSHLSINAEIPFIATNANLESFLKQELRKLEN